MDFGGPHILLEPNRERNCKLLGFSHKPRTNCPFPFAVLEGFLCHGLRAFLFVILCSPSIHLLSDRSRCKTSSSKISSLASGGVSKEVLTHSIARFSAFFRRVRRATVGTFARVSLSSSLLLSSRAWITNLNAGRKVGIALLGSARGVEGGSTKQLSIIRQGSSSSSATGEVDKRLGPSSGAGAGVRLSNFARRRFRNASSSSVASMMR